MSRPIAPSSSLTKPAFDAKFHIDYDWWEHSGQDLEVYLTQQLCEAHRASIADDPNLQTVVDWVDPVTGQVSQQNRLSYLLLSHCSQLPDYITERTSLVDAVFRVLLASGNRPMSPAELAQRTGRSPETIFKTLSGRTVYRGLRPVTNA